VGVFRRVDDPRKNGRRSPPQIEVAYVARLEPGPSVALRFSPLVEKESPRTMEELDLPNKDTLARRYPNVGLDTWDRIPIFADPNNAAADARGTEPNKTRIRLTRLAKLAADRLRLLPGDVRLIGWTDQRLPGMRISPEAPQNNTYTLVLAHLIRGALPPAKPDKNVAEDYLDPKYQIEEEAATTPDAATADPGLTP